MKVTTEGGVMNDPRELTVEASLDRLANEYLHGELSPSTRATLLKQAKADEAQLRALVLGSPEFQRR